MVSVVPRLSVTPGEIREAGALHVGAHNEEVYCGRLGLSRDELAALGARGVV
jgi:formyl-CoA transferase